MSRVIHFSNKFECCGVNYFLPGKRILKPSDVLEIAKRVTVCPICGGTLFATFEEWTEINGQWKASEIHLLCESEPDFDLPQYDE